MHYETIEDQPRKGYNDSGLTNSLPFHPPQSNSEGDPMGEGKIKWKRIECKWQPVARRNG